MLLNYLEFSGKVSIKLAKKNHRKHVHNFYLACDKTQLLELGVTSLASRVSLLYRGLYCGMELRSGGRGDKSVHLSVDSSGRTTVLPESGIQGKWCQMKLIWTN